MNELNQGTGPLRIYRKKWHATFNCVTSTSF